MKKAVFVVFILLAFGISSLYAQKFPKEPGKLTFGIYANPVGFLTFGPIVGAEITWRHLNLETHVRFPSLGLLMPYMHSIVYDVSIENGFGVGIGGKFFLPSRIGGFFVGGFFEYSRYKASYDNYAGEYDITTAQAFGVSIGYRFVLSFGLYFRVGAYLGAASSKTANHVPYSYNVKHYKEIEFFALPDLAIGFSF